MHIVKHCSWFRCSLFGLFFLFHVCFILGLKLTVRLSFHHKLLFLSSLLQLLLLCDYYCYYLPLSNGWFCRWMWVVWLFSITDSRKEPFGNEWYRFFGHITNGIKAVKETRRIDSNQGTLHTDLIISLSTAELPREQAFLHQLSDNSSSPECLYGLWFGTTNYVLLS